MMEATDRDAVICAVGRLPHQMQLNLVIMPAETAEFWAPGYGPRSGTRQARLLWAMMQWWCGPGRPGRLAACRTGEPWSHGAIRNSQHYRCGGHHFCVCKSTHRREGLATHSQKLRSDMTLSVRCREGMRRVSSREVVCRGRNDSAAKCGAFLNVCCPGGARDPSTTALATRGERGGRRSRPIVLATSTFWTLCCCLERRGRCCHGPRIRKFPWPRRSSLPHADGWAWGSPSALNEVQGNLTKPPGQGVREGLFIGAGYSVSRSTVGRASLAPAEMVAVNALGQQKRGRAPWICCCCCCMPSGTGGGTSDNGSSLSCLLGYAPT